MSLRASGDLRVVARGKIRVDARRAIAKLREHLLVDLHLYAREIVRSAIAGGATAIDVHYDADDVLFTFDGEPIAEAVLPRLLDHVIGDATTAEARRLRTLALGVNAALGLRPAFIDAILANGNTCIRMRFTPAMLETGEDTSAEPSPACEPIAAPAGMPARGMRIHLKRRAGWSVLRRVIARDMPPELVSLAEAAHGARVKLTLSGRPFPHAPRPPALLRVPFHETGLRDAALEIVPPASGPPQLDFLENGVLLIRKRWSGAPVFPDEPFTNLDLPVRVIADAPELPTNASRSALREDALLPRRTAEASIQAFRDARTALQALVFGKGEIPPGVEVLDRDPVRLEDALGNLVCMAGSAVDRGLPLSDEARALLDLPLLRDAVNRPMTARSLLARDRKAPVYVWLGKEPLSEAVAHWMGGVVWLRGRTVEKLLACFRIADAAQILEKAQAGLERRKALLAHPRTEPVLPEASDLLVREVFHVEEGPFAGLRGEVGIRRPNRESSYRGAMFRIFVEGRHMDTIEVDSSKVPLPLDAALSWEGFVGPTFRYDAIEPNRFLRLALWYATRVGIIAVNALAERLGTRSDHDKQIAELAPVIRAAAGTHAVSTEQLGVDPRPHEPPLMTYNAIWHAKAWPSTEPDKPVSLRQLTVYAGRTRAICTAPPGTKASAADERPVLALARTELQWITALFPMAVLVPYADALVAGQSKARRQMALRSVIRERRDCPAMVFRRPGIEGRIVLSSEARLTFMHAGRTVHVQAPPAELGPVALAVDDNSIVPEPHFRGIRWQNPPEWLEAVGHEFLERILAAVAGDRAIWAALAAPDDNSPEGPSVRPDQPAILDCPEGNLVRAYLIYAATTVQKPGLKAAIEALPLVTLVNERGEETTVSLSTLAATHPAPGPIPFLRYPPGFETFDWSPVILKDPAELTALERWSCSRTRLADQELANRRELARLERERQEFLKKPLLDLHSVGDLADPDAHVMFHMIADTERDTPPPPSPAPPADEDITIAAALPHLRIVVGKGAAGRGQDISIAAALPRQGFEMACPIADVLFEGRFLCQVHLPSLQMPVVARAGLRSQEHVLPWHGLTGAGIEALTARVHETAHALALELLAARSSSGEPFYANIRLLRLIDTLLRQPVPAGSTGETTVIALKLFDEPMRWPTVQGEEHPWNRLKQSAYGRVRYPEWRRPKGRADFDVPILHLPTSPAGTLIESILSQAGIVLRDVSELVEKLQASRIAKDSREPPRLSGEPVHPLLRTSLQAAGVTAAEGEMEIVEGPASAVSLVGLDGAPRSVDADLPIPLRLIARCELIDFSKPSVHPVLLDVSKGARNHLVGSVASRMTELPEFVRGHLRRVLCKSAGGKAKRMQKNQVGWEVIPDTTGAYHSLKSLQENPGVEWSYTTDAPPYPQRDYGGTVLRLTADEASALSGRVSLKDITGIMAKHRQAEVRANAPQVEAIRLTGEQHTKCLRVFRLDRGGTTGELGILAPEHAKSRGMIVHTTRRPLCVLSDMAGWPILAVINDDQIRPSAAFDGIRKMAQKEELKARIRVAANLALDEWLAPPPDALLVRRLHGVEWPEKTTIDVAGTLFLPAVWPHDARVHLRVHAVAEPRRQSLAVEPKAAMLSGVVPVAGNLLVMPALANSAIEEIAQDLASFSEEYMKTDAHMQALAGMALREAAILVAEALKEGSSPVLAAYQWDLRLLGATEAGEPTAPTAEGRRVTADEILLELNLRGSLWFTRHAGDTEGHFPDDPPMFILLDDGASPLLDVLRHRAPNALFELGGRPAAEAIPPAAVEPPGVAMTPPAITIESAVGPEPLEDAPQETGPGWFGGLVHRVAAAVATMAPEPEPPVPKETRAALLKAIDDLRLTRRAVTSVEYVRGGRPIRFDGAKSRLLLNRNHKAIAALIPRAHSDPRALTLLVCAAVSEINRGLDAITDAGERRALIELLQGEPSLGAS